MGQLVSWRQEADTDLASDHEGLQVAKWLNRRGITCFVCATGLSKYHSSVSLIDGLRAVRLVRYFSKI